MSDEQKEESRKYRYYKEYEKERFIRWFGTDHIPQLDISAIKSKKVCSCPTLSNNVYSKNFFDDASNLIDADVSRANLDNRTSQTLLTLAGKSTIDVVNNPTGIDEDGNEVESNGQFIEFVVGGNQ